MTTRLTLTRAEQLTPRLRRLWFSSADLTAFASSIFTDRYVKLVFPRPGVEYPHLDMRRLRREIDPADLPVIRTYTALFPDVDAGTLAIDFVVHGDDGVAGRWATHAVPGEELVVNGPGGGYAPDPDAAWHLLVGDESAIPAVGAALAALPSAAVARVVLLVDDSEHECALPGPRETQIQWLHRSTEGDGDEVLRDAVAALAWLPGRVHAFVHGEGEQIMKQVRPFLIAERGLTRHDFSVSAYWRRGRTEDGFREWKSALPAD